MSQDCRKDICDICSRSSPPTTKLTRARRNDWVQCDCCKTWLHSVCSGFSQAEQKKLQSNWFKCLLCCLQQISKAGEGRVEQCVKTISEVVHRRIDSSGKRKSLKLKDNKSHIINTPSSLPSDVDSSQVVNSPRPIAGTLCSEPGGSESPQVSLDHTVGAAEGSVLVYSEGDSASLPQGNAITDIHLGYGIGIKDNIVIVDDICNSVEFNSSKRILKEIARFCPTIKVSFAYSLARGGIAIHTANKEDRDFLLHNLPPHSFGGGTKHLPKVSLTGCPDSVFIKGVDTSLDIASITQKLSDLGVITTARRLCNRLTGKPSRVVKINCSPEHVNTILSLNLTVNGKACVIEKKRLARVVRCYRCQSFGHIAKNCINPIRCEVCSGPHAFDQCCKAYAKCANCSGHHPASSPWCPHYIVKHEDLTVQHSKH